MVAISYSEPPGLPQSRQEVVNYLREYLVMCRNTIVVQRKLLLIPRGQSWDPRTPWEGRQVIWLSAYAWVVFAKPWVTLSVCCNGDMWPCQATEGAGSAMSFLASLPIGTWTTSKDRWLGLKWPPGSQAACWQLRSLYPPTASPTQQGPQNSTQHQCAKQLKHWWPGNKDKTGQSRLGGFPQRWEAKFLCSHSPTIVTWFL